LNWVVAIFLLLLTKRFQFDGHFSKITLLLSLFVFPRKKIAKIYFSAFEKKAFKTAYGMATKTYFTFYDLTFNEQLVTFFIGISYERRIPVCELMIFIRWLTKETFKKQWLGKTASLISRNNSLIGVFI